MVISAFLKHINRSSESLILKGGTSLMCCYGLDRFSEDIDLDSRNTDIKPFVDSFCRDNNFQYRVAKYTDTVKRCFIHYGNEGHPLNIETSYRLSSQQYSNDVTKINGITTYSIAALLEMKLNAYENRDKIRDLYDITFIVSNYFNMLDSRDIRRLSNALSMKGLEHFDYLITTQSDDLINSNILVDRYLEILKRLEMI